MLGVRLYGEAQIDLFQGDITGFVCDAMGNAANRQLAGGGGVDGAIHEAGGPEIAAALRALGRECLTGEAVVTAAGDLPAKYVIHAVGPVWQGGNDGESDLLRKAYEATFSVAEECGAQHVALPSISTGTYGFPLEPAAAIAMQAAKDHLDTRREKTLRRVTFVLFNDKHHEAFQKAMFAAFPEAPL